MKWELKPISELCFLAIDCVNKTAPLSENITPYKMLRTTNVKNGFIDFESVRYVEENVFKKWIRRAQPQYGDVVFTREAPAGEVGRFTAKTGNYFLGQRLFLYRPDPGKLDWNYLAYSLQSPQIQGWVNGIAYGATVPHMAVSDMEHLKIPVPPISIQKRIGNILSHYDDLIENNLKRIKLLEEMAQITYEEWFVRMRFPGYESVPVNSTTGLPEGWNLILFGEKYKTASGGTPSRKQEALYFDNGTVPWIRTQELRNTLIVEPLVKITEAGLKNSSAKIFPANTVLLAMYGNTIGETALLRIPASTNQACCAFLSHEYESYFIYQYLILNKNLVLGYRMGAAQENISQEIVKSIKILNPTDDLIRSYADIVRPIYNSIENLMRQNQRLREARDILLPRLMTGVIDVESYNPADLLKEVA